MSNDLFKGVAIGIPMAGRPVPIEWAFSYKAMDVPINYNAVNITTQGMKVDDAREFIATEAQKNKVKYLMFLGDDTVPPPHIMRRFIFLMENNPEIQVIGGIYVVKSDPPFPLVFRGNGGGSYWDWKVGELFWVTGLGMDATMIRMSVFDKLPKPWFQTIKADGFADSVNKVEAWTEDLYFCDKVTKEFGEKTSVWADGSILCDHYDIRTGKKYSLPLNSKPCVRQYNVGKKKIVDLGCGFMREVFPEGVATRVDAREECEPDYRCDLRALPFENESWDIVYSSHTLEHFPKSETGKVLDEWLRILKVGGELRLRLPDLEFAAKQILNGGLDLMGSNVLYGQGDGKYDGDVHRNGFTMKSLRELLESKGLKVNRLWQEAPYNLMCQAIKTNSKGTVGDGEGRPLLKEQVIKGLLPAKRKLKKSARREKMHNEASR
jgi:predicted SAM-dependent methyltransferase